VKIHAVPLMRYMGTGTEGLQKMPEEFEAEIESIAIPTQVRWLATPAPPERGGRTEKSPSHQ
jgi:hypothetical protein